MKKIELKKGDCVPAISGEIEIVNSNGSGLFTCIRREYDGNGNVKIEEEAFLTAGDLESYHREATGQTVRYASYLDGEEEEDL